MEIEFNKYENKIVLLQKENDKLLSEIQLYKENNGNIDDNVLIINGLKNENKQLQETISQFREQIIAAAEAEEEEENLQERLSSALLEINSLKTNNKELTYKLDELNAKMKLLKQDHLIEINNLKEELDLAKKNKVDELNNLSIAKDEMTNKHQIHIKSLKSKIEELKVKLEKIQFEHQLDHFSSSSSATSTTLQKEKVS